MRCHLLSRKYSIITRPPAAPTTEPFSTTPPPVRFWDTVTRDATCSVTGAEVTPLAMPRSRTFAVGTSGNPAKFELRETGAVPTVRHREPTHCCSVAFNAPGPD